MGESRDVAIAPTPQLIVGLGNPGAKYDRTRHNVGFMLVDELARSWQINLADHKKFQGIFGEGTGPHRDKIRLLKPQTYMNLSGQSIRAVVDWYKLSPESVLVVYDDMDLPLGRLRLRLSGSPGGHNGMKSIISHLGTQNFPRLRIGIGKPKTVAPEDKDTVSHVLGQFSKAETEILTEVLRLCEAAIALSLQQSTEKAMSLYNNRIAGI
ncbi:aminoacyl-tRNA hydrolase [Thermoleptolyngbya sichuanensis A183]|uniref:Peptidyl-tRNA hydrolase n=1 Tax=Thermoleptolyngbya sichuanensis A183 TaxID=2737172 RepID=A0A6M8BEX5_9CYAN|nr:aminoacyl-tRNA hydrolase [Thermoleptolyngbya sichuanensis]QKD82181.1 aminoacyl-tRNA hydrolase [Thermoleptolyngbya sichuanensis A183]